MRLAASATAVALTVSAWALPNGVRAATVTAAPADPAADDADVPAEPDPGDAASEAVESETAESDSAESDSAESDSAGADATESDAREPAAPTERRPPQFGTPGAAVDPTPPLPDEPSFDAAPGGYWGPTDTKELPPADGRRKILIGSILAPLGLLAGTTGAAFTYLSVPDHCVERLGKIGIDTQRNSCGGLFALNIIRTTYGGLLLVTGSVLLVLGLRERNRRREWERHHSTGRRSGPRLALTPAAGGWAIRF